MKRRHILLSALTAHQGGGGSVAPRSPTQPQPPVFPRAFFTPS